MSGMSNTPIKGKRPGDKESPAAAPEKLETDGVEAAPSPLTAPAPSVGEAPAKQDSPAKTSAAAPAATPEAPPPTRRYRVWSHGTLQRDGKTLQPGDELTMAPDEAAKIPCLELVG
jgi:hypothetical protein